MLEGKWTLFFWQVELKLVLLGGILGWCLFFSVTFLWQDVIVVCSARWSYRVLYVFLVLRWSQCLLVDGDTYIICIFSVLLSLGWPDQWLGITLTVLCWLLGRWMSLFVEFVIHSWEMGKFMLNCFPGCQWCKYYWGSNDFLVIFVVCSKFLGVGLTSNYEEGGGKSSVTDVVSCQCVMDCNFEFCFSRCFRFFCFWLMVAVLF